MRCLQVTVRRYNVLSQETPMASVHADVPSYELPTEVEVRAFVLERFDIQVTGHNGGHPPHRE